MPARQLELNEIRILLQTVQTVVNRNNIGIDLTAKMIASNKCADLMEDLEAQVAR